MRTITDIFAQNRQNNRIMPYLFFVLMILILAGCGGGGGDDTPVSPAKTDHEYLPLDSNNEWYYNNSPIPVQLGNTISVAGQSVNPLIHPTGGKEYLLANDEGLHMAGIYAAEVTVIFGDGSSRSYTADARFSGLLTVLPNELVPGQSVSSRNGGTINIQPGIGEHALSFSATSRYIADEQVTVPYGTFLAKHIQIQGSINTTVQGSSFSMPISTELWLAKDIGIVKRIEHGQTFELTDATINITSPSPSKPANMKPVANAGIDQTVLSGATVSLSGTGSDEDGTIASYQWEQLSGPANITLTNALSAETTFVAPQVTVDTTYAFNLVVEDNQGETASDQVTITVTQNLSANAGNNQSVEENQPVQLVGSGATNEGAIQSYSWEQTAGSPTVMLNNATSSTASFQAPEVESDTTLTFTLTVKNSNGDIATDSVNIVIQNVNKLPEANAGADQTVDEKQTVNLVGSGSDLDGAITSYHWVQISGFPTVAIDNPTNAATSFFAPDIIEDTTFSFKLTVTDNNGAKATDMVNVLVKNVNIPPQANAGTDISVDEKTRVELAGSATDADGTIVNYAWTQTGGVPTVVLENASSATMSFTAPDVNFEDNVMLTFQLTVTDSNDATAIDNINVSVLFVNEPPIANAGPDQVVTDSSNLTLSGAASLDNDGVITTYQWRQITGSAVEIANPSGESISFIAPILSKQEDLVFEVEVTDDHGAIAQDTVEVSVVPKDAANHDKTGLTFSVIDAEYSDSQESIVMVSADPAQLHIFNTRSNSLRSVDLPLTPTAVAATPNGEFAAVGHNGWVSYVDLLNAQIVKSISVTTDVFDIITAGDGYIHAIPRGDQWEQVRSVNIDTDIETLHQGLSIRAGTKVKLHPEGIWVYGANRGLSPSDIEKYDISDGSVVKYLYDSPYHGDFAMCGDLWISEDGLRIFTACGNVFNSSSSRDIDMTYNRSLEGVSSIRSLSHSEETSSVLSISNASDTVIKSSAYEFLTFIEDIPLPQADNGVETFPNHGRFVFHKSNGSRYFAIVQADPAAGMLNDFAVVSSRSVLP